MNTRGRARAGMAAGALGFAVIVAAWGGSVQAQQKDKNPPKLDKVQTAEAQAITVAVDNAQYGDPVPSDIPVTMGAYHFFKAADGTTYVPFSMTVDPKMLADPNVTFLMRVVKKGALPAPPSKDKKALDVTAGGDEVNDLSDLRDLTDQERERLAQEKAKRPPLGQASYTNLEFPVLKSQSGGPVNLSRAFQVPAGEYDVYIGIKERNPADKKVKPKVTVSTLKITVPDLQAGELATSSLIIAEKIAPLPGALKPEQQRENPYTIGLLEIVPKVGTKFAKTDELNVYFQIYNAALDSAKKPDVLQEFAFFQKQGTTEKKVFTTEPAVLNASTLPKEFDPAKHQLPGGGGWALSSFPVGDYRLEIKVTDKVSGKTLTHSVNFSVS